MPEPCALPCAERLVMEPPSLSFAAKLAIMDQSATTAKRRECAGHVREQPGHVESAHPVLRRAVWPLLNTLSSANLFEQCAPDLHARPKVSARRQGSAATGRRRANRSRLRGTCAGGLRLPPPLRPASPPPLLTRHEQALTTASPGYKQKARGAYPDAGGRICQGQAEELADLLIRHVGRGLARRPLPVPVRRPHATPLHPLHGPSRCRFISAQKPVSARAFPKTGGGRGRRATRQGGYSSSREASLKGDAVKLPAVC
jgi:hypothetical protein